MAELVILEGTEVTQGAAGSTAWLVDDRSKFAVPRHDEFLPTYNADGTVATIVYKLGGTTVATATYTWTGGNCTRAVLT